ncbi:hypothetical protein, partial [Vibrio cholerae]|uniref:hypothetical protein n=1 Tax=Vibrio cholerae TaxID=666 RepID=UPI002B4BD843
MVAVVVFEFSVMRCQPLRRALDFGVGSVDVLSIILGWLLGILSPVIVSRVTRQYKRDDLHKGIMKEVDHIRERLLGNMHLLSHRTGSFDRELAKWLLEKYSELDAVNPIILESYKTLLAADDTEFEAYKYQFLKSQNTGLTLQKFQLTFVNMHLLEFSLFSSEFQTEMFELKTRLEFLNSEIVLAEKYFFMTFDSGLSQENLDIVKADLTNKYLHIETMIKRVVEQIETICSV